MIKSSHQLSEDTLYFKNNKVVASICINNTIDKIQRSGDTEKLIFQENHKYPLASLRINDRLFPLQSRRSPEEEAKNICNHLIQNTSKKCTLSLLGIPNLYLIAELIKNLPEKSTLILLETSASYLRKLFHYCDLCILSSSYVDIKIICDEDPTVLAVEYHKTISKLPCLSEAVYITPAQVRLRPELCQIQSLLNTKIRLSAMDRTTVAQFADEWLQNCLINLPEICQSPGIKIFYDQFKNKNAIVVCAGPSLNKSLEYIKNHQNQYLIIAVGTALKPCLNAGVQPHFTIALDSDPKVYRQFMDIPNAPGVLLTSYTLFPGIIQMYAPKILPFNSSATAGFAAWLKKSECEHGSLNIGGTVSLSAIDCALRFGCKNVYIFGLDLSFAKDGTSHAKNSMYEGQKISEGLVKVKGNKYKTVNTTRQFANYIEIMNNYFRDTFTSFNGKIFNVNPAGAYFEKLILMKPEEFNLITNHKTEDLHTFISKYLTPAGSNIDNTCIDTINSFKEICKKSKNLLDSDISNEISSDLQDFENEIKNNSLCSQLLEPALRSWCIDVENNEDQSPHEMTLNLLNQIYGASEWICGLLENSYNRYKQQIQGAKNG